MTNNPYALPTDSSAPISADNAERTLGVIARETFLTWEKLRIVYVMILAVITLFFVSSSVPLDRRWMLLVLEGAFVANVAYFAGPVIETYVRWLGYDRDWPRWVMFVCGTLLSVALAVGLLEGELLPNQH